MCSSGSSVQIWDNWCRLEVALDRCVGFLGQESMDEKESQEKEDLMKIVS